MWAGRARCSECRRATARSRSALRNVPTPCRGGDYSLVHCSEVGIWKATLGKTPEQILRSACSGVLLKPMTMIVYESTANGTGNFFHREYDAAKRGLSQFESMFVAWYTEIDQYSAPVADTAEFASRLLAGRECDAAENDRSQPGRYLWWLWERGATLEAISWYISERSKYSDHGLTWPPNTRAMTSRRSCIQGRECSTATGWRSCAPAAGRQRTAVRSTCRERPTRRAGW